MPVNFFKPQCESSSIMDQFGLCDDPVPATSPAYIDEENPDKWIGVVRNPNNEKVHFYAIDHCVEVLNPDGKMDKRCDGLLFYSNNLVFVELKSRKSKKWFKEGREQLTVTVKRFMTENNIRDYKTVEAYVCNNLRPMAHVGQAANIQQFKDETGLVLNGGNKIALK